MSGVADHEGLLERHAERSEEPQTLRLREKVVLILQDEVAKSYSIREGSLERVAKIDSIIAPSREGTSKPTQQDYSPSEVSAVIP